MSTSSDLDSRPVLAPIPILDKYAHGVSTEMARPPWLATISAGTKDANGYPRATRQADPRWIHIAAGDNAPGLAAALEAGGWRELTIALPSNDHRDFLSQRFVRYGRTRVEAFGDATAMHVLSTHKVQRGNTAIEEALPRQTYLHGTPEYDREVDQCSVAGSLLFLLARWRDRVPELYFPDALGLYRLRFTSRTSLQRLVGGIEQLRALTGGSIEGMPLRLSLQFGEVADAGGTKRTVPYWAVQFASPPGTELLTAASWSGFKAAAFAEAGTLRALPSGAAAAITADVLEVEGPDVDLDDPPVDAETTASLSRRYDEVFNVSDVVEVRGRTVDRATGEVLAEPPRPTTGNTAMLQRQHELRALVERALKLGAIDRAPDAIAAGASPAQVEAAIQLVRGKLNQLTITQAQRATTAAQPAAGEDVPAPPAPRRAELWAIRRQLEVKALELGIAVPTLNTRCPDDELAAANDALRASIKAVEDDLTVEELEPEPEPEPEQEALV